MGPILLVPVNGAAIAEPARILSRSEVPAAVEAELSTREILCRLEDLGGLVIPQGALGSAELAGEGGREFIVTLCRLACSKKMPQVGVGVRPVAYFHLNCERL